MRTNDGTERAQKDPTPLQQELDRTGKRITVIMLGICAIVFATDARRIDHADETLSLEQARQAAVDRLADVVPDAAGSVVWTNDGSAFYVRLDRNHRPSRVFRHRLGMPVEDDVLVYEGWISPAYRTSLL